MHVLTLNDSFTSSNNKSLKLESGKNSTRSSRSSTRESRLDASPYQSPALISRQSNALLRWPKVSLKVCLVVVRFMHAGDVHSDGGEQKSRGPRCAEPSKGASPFVSLSLRTCCFEKKTAGNAIHIF